MIGRYLLYPNQRVAGIKIGLLISRVVAIVKLRQQHAREVDTMAVARLPLVLVGMPDFQIAAASATQLLWCKAAKTPKKLGQRAAEASQLSN
ncbi:MAG: hypothetical protein HC822_11215 [Oscillochloris sp.]|nr:hypothetical protein [Oscillochloris sp.]